MERQSATSAEAETRAVTYIHTGQALTIHVSPAQVALDRKAATKQRTPQM
jgi:hypothetical protein